MSYAAPSAEDLADQQRDNPTVVEVGIAPFRVTIPLTSEARRSEALWASAAVVGLSAAVLVFGGKFIKEALAR